MNPVVMLHIIRMNPSPTKMSKEGLSHPGQITRLHNNSHHLRKAAKSAPSSMDQQLTKKRVPRAILQGPQVTSHKDQPLQHLQHGLEDHHRLPQSLNQVQASRIHWNAMTPMDPPKHPQMARAQVLPSQRRHRQMQMQPLSLLTLLHVLDVVKVATEAKTVHIIIFFVIFVG